MAGVGRRHPGRRVGRSAPVDVVVVVRSDHRSRRHRRNVARHRQAVRSPSKKCPGENRSVGGEASIAGVGDSALDLRFNVNGQRVSARELIGRFDRVFAGITRAGVAALSTNPSQGAVDGSGASVGLPFRPSRGGEDSPSPEAAHDPASDRSGQALPRLRRTLPAHRAEPAGECRRLPPARFLLPLRSGRGRGDWGQAVRFASATSDPTAAVRRQAGRRQPAGQRNRADP